MENFLVVKVAINNINYCADKLYSYLVPIDLQSQADVGKRAIVPFGIHNSKKTAVIFEVISFDELHNVENLKSILAILDEEPILSQEMLQLSFYMKKAYFCTLCDAIKCMLPSGPKSNSSVHYSVADLDGSIFDDLSDFQKQLVSFIKNNSNLVSLNLLKNNFNFNANDYLKELLDKKIIFESEKFVGVTHKAADKILVKNDTINFEHVKLTKKQSVVLDLLSKNPSGLSTKEIVYFSGVSAAVVKGLLNKNLLLEKEIDVFSENSTNLICETHTNLIELSYEQENVYNKLKQIWAKHQYSVVLLFGITGSGKTSVFLKLIGDVLKSGKSVIVMVPEIALTPQIVTIFKSNFGDNVEIFHSALSPKERVTAFNRVKNGEAKLIIGTRSAIFAPVANLGLVVIDEEHDGAYKSDFSPRYHAREVAKYRCFVNNAMLLLCSATPSIESFYFAKKKEYHLCKLTKRFGNIALPSVQIIDMSKEVEVGNFSFFSRDLLKNLKNNVDNAKQSIILLNRRGCRTFIKCRSCETILMCKNCAVPLVYHVKNNKFMCHYCGYSLNATEKCPHCGEASLMQLGVGTQLIEEELKKSIPESKILRMDADTTLRKNSHNDQITDFFLGKYDILVGTQMVAKGLNFKNVTLVGVISVDNMLMSDDFRSDERTFSLITQVVGRAGRFENGGKAIIQTFSPNSETIKLAADQDYEAFYSREIEMRKVLQYPPFVELAVIFFVGKNENYVKNASKAFFVALKQKIVSEYSNFAVKIFAPAPNAIAKINNKYKYKIVVKYKNKVVFRQIIGDLLGNLNNDKIFNKVLVYVDTSPNYSV